MISGVCCEVDENCVLLGYCIAVRTQKSAVLMCRVFECTTRKNEATLKK
jgi:hypothetical protein